jgi:hypothetical protein
MAASLSSTINSEVPGASKFDLILVNPGTYATSGVSVTAALLGFQSSNFIVPLCLGKLDGTVNAFKWDQTNSKIWYYNGSTEVSNGTDLSTYLTVFLVSRRP